VKGALDTLCFCLLLTDGHEEIVLSPGNTHETCSLVARPKGASFIDTLELDQERIQSSVRTS
jgi:hypothetical protein